jgi:two-component system chemotaxis response regulator CheB
VMGASTGGVAAITQILPSFPATTSGIVLVEHLPPGFSEGLAERLNNISAMRVREAADGDRILSGHVLVAPGGIHTEIVRSGGEYRIKLTGTERVSGHVPSVDVLFRSAAQAVGKNAVGVLMTGMGADGAKGLLELRRTGARTCAQDEASSVIFGMPGAAWEIGAAEVLVALDDIPRWVLRALQR